MSQMGRRDFLRLAGATLGTSALAGCDAPQTPLRDTPQPTLPAATTAVSTPATPPVTPLPSVRSGKSQPLTGPWKLLSDQKTLAATPAGLRPFKVAPGQRPCRA
jgi:hypothetical protein